MASTFLDRIYAAETDDERRQIYTEWAASYDEEVSVAGYVTPERLANALSDHADKTTPILDFGCGTGLSGLALKAAGFAQIDGTDISEEMLAKAREKAIYRSLSHIAPTDPIPSGYSTICASGVVSAGAAPPSTLGDLLKALPQGGHLGLSYNDHTLKDPAYTGALNDWIDCGATRLLFREYGDHLPGIGLKSTVYVLEKA
ncbi:class I SAM-dependent DNA methyltransferase [Aestuariibius sp. 2305UL40-4]|uniref:class I SAM-dependent DNA methyltransferase n=1 Tax=Aestuariibius violaceus TaxID=3234132 RepID=UPI00345E1334